MSDVLQNSIPVITLLLGAWIGWFLKRGDTRRAAQLEAGDTLAELPRFVWTKGADGDYQNLQVYLGRLRIRLKAAEVPQHEIDTLIRVAREHWSDLYETSGPDGEDSWGVSTELHDQLNAALDGVQGYLLASWKKRRELRRAGTSPAE